MAPRPKPLSERPTPLDLENPRGDVLSDVLTVALLRNAIYRRIEGRAPWGIRISERPRATFYAVARGTVWLEVEGHPPFALAAGDVAFLPHGEAHVLRDARTTVPRAVCDGPTRHIAQSNVVRSLGGDGAAASIMAGFFELDGRTPALLAHMPDVVVMPSGDDPRIQATVQLLLSESTQPGLASTLVLHRLADVLFVHALRLIARDPRAPKGLPALTDPVIHQALSLMHRDTSTAWTVAALAKAVGLSRSGFAARFNELVGEPPLQYLARWRIARAAELLRDGDDSIAAIAGRVGYESLPSFSKAFKRWRGASPGVFRAAVQRPAV